MPPPVKTFGERIADALVEDGLLSARQVEELLQQQKKEGTRLLKLILEKAYVSEQVMAVSMGRVLNTPPINLARINIPTEIADLLPRELAHNHKVVPVSRLENKLFLAMADPLNVLAIDDVKRITRLEVAQLIAAERAIIEKLNNIDAAKSGSMEDIIQDARKKGEADADADNVEISRETVEEVNLDQLAASSEEAPVIKLANLILVQAVKDRASDVHIEPFEKGLRLRYRIDGVLIDATPPPKQMQLALASRFKIMSSLDIAERRLPQDGRMRIRVGGKDYDLRVSIMPTVHGEKIVLRLLDKSNLSASLDKLGLDIDTYQQFKAAVDAPHGLILVTGPTGSGKTTTLYSALNELNSPIFNIVTVEDPVEFQVPGINQVPTKMYQDLLIDPSLMDGPPLYRGRGCERCKNSGYAGRLAIIEAMTVSDEIRKLIIARANNREMGKIAIGQGMRTLRMVALDRVRDGTSTLEQVLVLTSGH